MRRGITAIAIAIALGLTGTAQAATYQVTKRGDHAPGACTRADCTLREAVLAANASVGVADRIVLPSRRPYRLTIPGDEDGAMAGDLDLTNDPVSIVHRGRGRAKIEQTAADRVFEGFAPATLRKLVITGGEAQLYGGGLRSGDRLRLVQTTVARNEVVGPGFGCGGGIHMNNNSGPLTLIRSQVSGNRSLGNAGGISASCTGSGGPVTIRRSVVANNVSDSDAGPPGGGYGAGIYLQTGNGIQSVIDRTTFAGNRMGGATNGSDGGGIYTDLGRLRLTNSTISGNRAGEGGGGISVQGTEPLQIVNSTVYGNRANDHGGGIGVESGIASMRSSTVVRNRGNADGDLSEAGGGLWLGTADAFAVENSLIALNTLTALTPGDPPVNNDCSGVDAFDSRGHNLLSTRFLCDGFVGPGDRVRSNPRVLRLKRNGGPTKTVALKANSAAIGKAKRSTSPNRDQRGRKRDRRPDIGAFELVR